MLSRRITTLMPKGQIGRALSTRSNKSFSTSLAKTRAPPPAITSPFEEMSMSMMENPFLRRMMPFDEFFRSMEAYPSKAISSLMSPQGFAQNALSMGK